MKVLIPTAGVGSRLGDLTNHMNKAMIAVGKRPVISHIIDRYPTNTEFIIALGYKGDYLRQYLELAYPRRDITLVDVDLFEGPGSGPSYTLRQCKEYIDSEFIYHANDSIIADDSLEFNFDADTMLAVRDDPDPINYRTVSIDHSTGKVTGVYDKLKAPGQQIYNYIGVGFIKRYRDFVDALDGMPIEIGESAYFMRAIEHGVNSYLVDAWYDIGNLDQLRKANSELSDFDNLQKPGESLYFIDGRVHKFSVDTDFIKDRVSRAKDLEGIIPNIVKSSKNFYVYNYVPGEVLSEIASPSGVLESLLRWSEDNLWTRYDLSPTELDAFERTCFMFYYDKTMDRINEFFGEYDLVDSKNVVNGANTETLDTLLGDLNWSELKRGTPVRFHGDFHFENILKTDGGFVLLDWRQNFGGEQRYGDIYYDLAKLLHGLILNHGIIKKELFDVSADGNEIEFDFYRKNSLFECQRILKIWCDKRGHDWSRVLTITALVFLNIAALHHYPYSHLLFFLGKYMLNDQSNRGHDGVDVI